MLAIAWSLKANNKTIKSTLPSSLTSRQVNLHLELRNVTARNPNVELLIGDPSLRSHIAKLATVE